jgi:hypothetical protein
MSNVSQKSLQSISLQDDIDDIISEKSLSIQHDLPRHFAEQTNQASSFSSSPASLASYPTDAIIGQHVQDVPVHALPASSGADLIERQGGHRYPTRSTQSKRRGNAEPSVSIVEASQVPQQDAGLGRGFPASIPQESNAFSMMMGNRLYHRQQEQLELRKKTPRNKLQFSQGWRHK